MPIPDELARAKTAADQDRSASAAPSVLPWLESDEDNMSNEDNAAAMPSGAMRIFIFKSEVSLELRAFGGDLAGMSLPSQFKPWRAIGSIAPGDNPPHNLSREVIETAINERGYQLWRMSKNDADRK